MSLPISKIPKPVFLKVETIVYNDLKKAKFGSLIYINNVWQQIEHFEWDNDDLTLETSISMTTKIHKIKNARNKKVVCVLIK